MTDPLPPSAKYVLHTLAECGGELPRKEVVSRADFWSERTIERALATLEDRGDIERNAHPEDDRETVISLADAPETRHNVGKSH